MAKALGVRIEWRPFTLDIPSYLGSAKVNRKKEVVASDRTKDQWTGVRYAYRDARRYASLSGKTLRGTEKIWDSSLAGIAMLWAKRRGDEFLDRFLDEAYLAFWRRELDIENVDVLEQVLQSAGVEVDSFADYLADAGRAEHDELNESAFDAGVYGVPTYLVGDEMWFGREQLPRIEWLLKGGQGDAPDVANRSFGPPGETTRMRRSQPPSESNTVPIRNPIEIGEGDLTVVLDLRLPHAYLGLHPALRFARERGLAIDWLPLSASTLKPPSGPPADREDRSIRHRRFRSEALAREIEVSAECQGLEIREFYRAGESTAYNLGWLWLREYHLEYLVDFLSEGFRAYWRVDLDPTSESEIAALIDGLDPSLDANFFLAWCRDKGPEMLKRMARDLSSRGVFSAPSYLVGDEIFLGRQHLPLINWLTQGQSGEIPI
jgi:2-hydroxychromene-2-carboxylate isomerase